MLSDKADNFIEKVLSYVDYPFSKKSIRLELESHINEKINVYSKNGHNDEEAEDMAISEMGEAREIGLELNKLHKPILGWFLKNIKALAIIAILIVFSITMFNVGENYAIKKEMQRDTSTYINNLYWQINSTTNLLKYVEQWETNSVNNNDQSENPFYQLLTGINSMNILSQTAVSYIGYSEDMNNVKNLADSFDLIYLSIGGGVKYNDQLICNQFLEDGKISENEKKFLIELRENLSIIQSSLLDNKTKDINFDITIEEFSKIINPFVNKYRIMNLDSIGLAN